MRELVLFTIAVDMVHFMICEQKCNSRGSSLKTVYLIFWTTVRAWLNNIFNKNQACDLENV